MLVSEITQITVRGLDCIIQL